MEQRRLGANGPVISSLGVGALSFSDFYGVTNEGESHAVLDAAREAGVTHIDTANVYGMGRSENAIGSYLRANPAARESFVIATKAGISRDADGNRIFDNTPKHLEAELDASLERMGVEAVDLFYVHRRNHDVPIEDVAGALGRLVEKGKTRGIGFSEIAPSSLRRAHAVHAVTAVQSEYSLSTRTPEMGLVQTCAELGAAFVAFSPVGRSYLTDRPLSQEAAQGLAFLKPNPRFNPPHYQRNIETTDRFRALAAEIGEPAAALAIAWVLAQGEHVIAIPGTRSVGHFAELVRGAEIEMTPELLGRIEVILPVGWAHGERYSADQWVGVERYG